MIRLQLSDRGRRSLRQGALVAIAMIGAVVALGACAPRQPTYSGGQNVDPAKYNYDLAACQQQAASSFSTGNAVTDCMRARGYNVM